MQRVFIQTGSCKQVSDAIYLDKKGEKKNRLKDKMNRLKIFR